MSNIFSFSFAIPQKLCKIEVNLKLVRKMLHFDLDKESRYFVMDTTLLVLGVCSILLIVAIIFLMGRWSGVDQNAEEIIAKHKKGFVHGKFPEEYKKEKPDKIYQDADNPKLTAKQREHARTAKKLLDRREYDK